MTTMMSHALAAANDMDRLSVADDGQACASRVKFDLDLPSAAADDQPLGPGESLPEWDWKHQVLLPAHCRVQRRVVASPPPYAAPRRPCGAPHGGCAAAWRCGVPRPDARAGRPRVRNSTSTPGCATTWRPPAHRTPTSPAVYTRRLKSERSLATLLLADLSLSTDAYASNTARVIDVIRDAMFVFGEALAASGDSFEMLGFSSVRRSNVRIQHLKGFDEAWNAATQARVGAIRPGYYTRMGAAIRHATSELIRQPERQRLLLILTDGKPNDLDVYEGRWGLEDTRHAVQSARAAGLTPFCVTIDQHAHDYLPLLFGQRGYALVHRPQDLVTRLAGVHAALAGR